MLSLKEKLKTLPQSSGVYLMKDKNNNIIYVGKAKILKRRVNQYFDNAHNKNLKTQLLVSNICDFEYIVTNSEYDALMLENNLIKKYQPHYNILLKDDKNFAYLKINLNNDFPKIEITRKVEFKKNVKYFGPYFNGISAKSVLDIIKFAYPLRTCNLKLNKCEKRECLKYALGECSAPCTKRISKQDYKKIVDDAIKFLNGDTKNVEEILKEKMMKSADAENFERAIVLKGQIETLQKLKNKYTTQFTRKLNIDIVGTYLLNDNACVTVLIIRNGKMIGSESFNLVGKLLDENYILDFFVQYYSNNKLLPSSIIVDKSFKSNEILEEFFIKNFNKRVVVENAERGTKKLLLNQANNNAKEYLEKSLNQYNLKEERTIKACENLQKKLGLKSVPYRIEGFDISNISGTNKVASMVVFVNGEASKSQYRKFKIKSVEGQDDFACMNEVIERRIKELCGSDESFSKTPNLILIDGGKGQLSSACEALRKLNSDIEIISLAKKDEEIYRENESQPVLLNKSDYSLQLLQRVRDESHRFAISFHRNLRNKNELVSQLDKIDGVGKQKSKKLYNKFKTIDNIKNATIQALTTVEGINEKLAIKILNYFKKSD